MTMFDLLERGRGVLIAARQTYGEHGFSVVGSHGYVAPMGCGNFPHDIQSEPEAYRAIIAVTLTNSPFKRIKDLVQDRFLNGQPTILYFNGNAALVAGKHDVDRRVCRSVNDRIHNQVAENLLQASPVPDSPSVASDLQFDLPGWMRSPQLFQFIIKQSRQVDVGQGDMDTNAQLSSIEID